MALKRAYSDEKPAFSDLVLDPSTNDTDPGGYRVVAERVRAVVELAGGRAKASRQTGIPLGSLNNYLKGRDLPRGALVALSDAIGISIEWLATGRGPMLSARVTSGSPGANPLGEHSDDTHLSTVQQFAMPDRTIAFLTGSETGHEGFLTIPRYNIQASAGNGALVDHEQVVEYLAFHERFLRDHIRRPVEHLLIIEARGSSMEPGICDGDALLVDISPDQTLEDGRLYVLRVTEHLLVKRIEVRVTGAVVLHSDNPRYAPETIEPDALDQLHIIGRVIWTGGPPRS